MQLQESFEAAFLAAKGPKNAAMFKDRPSRQEFVYYFSPVAVGIFKPTLATYGATECDAPQRSRKTFFRAGHDQDHDLLMP